MMYGVLEDQEGLEITTLRRGLKCSFSVQQRTTRGCEDAQRIRILSR